MTRFLLIRHGAHALGGDVIAGRRPGVHLSPLGREQAARLPERVKHLNIRAIYSSPMERTRETAQPLGDALGLPVQISEALIEVNYGDWTAQRLDELRKLELWKRWNTFRSGTRAPNGETVLEIQTRVAGEMLRLREAHGDECIALFSHGDVIRAALSHWFAIPIDLFIRVEISLVSITAMTLGDYGPWLLALNNRERVEFE